MDSSKEKTEERQSQPSGSQNQSSRMPVQRSANQVAQTGSIFTPMRLFDDLLRGFIPDFQGTENFLVVPRVDVEDRDDEYVMTVDIPGVSQEDIVIEVADNRLTVTAERGVEKEGKRRSARVYGAFQRTFMLPSGVDTKNITAELENGVLSVHIPRTEKAKPRKIEIGKRAQQAGNKSH